MEWVAAASILGLGYVFQNQGYEPGTKKKVPFVDPPVRASKKPTAKNVYDSNLAYDIWQKEQGMADELAAKSRRPQETNVIVAGPPDKQIYNKVDYAESSLPIEFNQFSSYESNYADLGDPEKASLLPRNMVQNNMQVPESGGFKGISLTGDAINPNTFTHNNMQPFFGGTVKQNMDEFATRGIFETFTGTQDNYQKKKEQGLLFEPQKNVTNVYGQSNLDGYMLDRYHVSQVRSNETPIEKVYVGPGLNKGYTATPSGGFQQADTLDYIMPKTTNETRVRTNPKLSYYGRVNAGQKVAKPGKVGTLFKNRPDTFYVQTPDRYLTTTGAVTAPGIRPCQIVKFTNRKTTSQKSRKGPAAPTSGTRIAVRGKYRASDRQTYETDGPRNATLSGLWSLLGFGEENESRPDDYGKKSLKLGPNNRTDLAENKQQLNLKGNEKGVARNGQGANHTKRQEMEENDRAGNLAGGAYKSKVYDPEEKARRTVKETTSKNDHTGHMARQAPSRGVVYDPEDLPKMTVKETTSKNKHMGSMARQAPSRGIVYDPTDTPKTTVKETTSKNDYMGSMQADIKKGIVYDPEDCPKDTLRQDTSIYYVGNQDGEDVGGYQTTEVNAPNTMRQFTSDIAYTGNAGNSGTTNVPQSRDSVDNAVVRSLRDGQDRGYTPNAQGVNQMQDAHQSVVMTTKKVGDLQSRYLNERGVQPTKVYGSIPQANMTSVSAPRNSLPNEPLEYRNVDPSLIKAFKENPYTQSLQSWA